MAEMICDHPANVKLKSDYTPTEILLVLLKQNYSCSFIFSGLSDVDEPTTSTQ